MDRQDNHARLASVRRQAAAGGLTFEAYLPPTLAEWVIRLVEQEVFHSPAEAVFVAVQSFRELDEHPDVKQALLNRMLQKGMDSLEESGGTQPRRSWRACRKRWQGQEQHRPCGIKRSTGRTFPKTKVRGSNV